MAMDLLRKKRTKKLYTAQRNIFYLILPLFGALLLFSYVPLYGWLMAFTRYKPAYGSNFLNAPWVGFDNFKRMFGFGSNFGRAITNTLAMGSLNLLCFPLPLIIAILLMEIRRKTVRKIIQVGIAFPNFISIIVVYSLFYSLFSIDTGLVNKLLSSVGFSQPFNPLGNASITWYFQTCVGIWKGVGWSSIIYLSNIAAINPDLYAVAAVDGANRLRQVWHITVPGVMPTFIVLLLLSMGTFLSGASSFEQVLAFHNPAVAPKIETIDYLIYRIGLVSNDYALSTAMSIFKAGISLTTLFSINFFSKYALGETII